MFKVIKPARVGLLEHLDHLGGEEAVRFMSTSEAGNSQRSVSSIVTNAGNLPTGQDVQDDQHGHVWRHDHLEHLEGTGGGFPGREGGDLFTCRIAAELHELSTTDVNFGPAQRLGFFPYIVRILSPEPCVDRAVRKERTGRGLVMWIAWVAAEADVACGWNWEHDIVSSLPAENAAAPKDHRC